MTDALKISFLLNDDKKEPKLSIQLAKKRHYKPHDLASRIQKRTGAARPQGRPFTNHLNAKFFAHGGFVDVFCYLTNYASQNFVVGTMNPNDNTFRPRDALKYTCLCRHNKGLSMEFLQSNTNDDLVPILCYHFKMEMVTFLKVIRDTHCRVAKIETFKPNEMDENIYYDDLEFETMGRPLSRSSLLTDGKCTAKWIKKNIAYPRYKSGMKIHMLRGVHNFVLYNSSDLFKFDLKVGNLRGCNKTIILSLNGVAKEKYFD